jgi:DNA mismatch repair protein MutL
MPAPTRVPIRTLDDLTVARIAAGEVVERPASVVKELVENSLDAGADEIRVEVQAGGRRLIRVADNGQGIAADEAELAFQTHATSKIRASADLDRIATLGFRGEALASIAAVSHVTLLTRATGEEAGLQLRIDNGQVVARYAIGAPPGTVISVENLFNAVPARLKFLRNETTESAHIHDVVVHYALAYPDRRFTLVSGGRTGFQSPGTGELEDTLIAAFGLNVAREMIEIRYDPAAPRPGIDDDLVAQVRVRGYTSPPHVHRATRRHITLFVNGRWIQDSHLAYAVAEAYHTLLPKGRHPLAVVMIELPHEVVDVNVHPAKTEVRFRNGRPVFAAVQRAVRAAVVGQAPVAPARGAGEGGDAPWLPDLWRSAGKPRPRFDPLMAFGPENAADEGGGREDGTEGGSEGGAARSGDAALLPFDLGRAQDRGDRADWVAQGSYLGADGVPLPLLRVVGQVAQMYVVAEGPDGLYLIDQHAAHERVMYERFMARDTPIASQPLLAPEPVVLTRHQLGAVEDHMDSFIALGFDIEPFGADTALVRALPEVLARRADVAETVRTVLDLAGEGGTPIEDSFEARLVRAVCKQATVKAGQTLTLPEMQALVRNLEACASPRTCPHGRPTMIVFSAERLFREFGRG